MATSKESIEVRLGELKVPLKSTGPDAQLAHEVAKLVSERIDEAQKRAKTGTPPHQVALLALMDLGEEYLLARRRTEEFRNEVEARTKALLERIERLEHKS